MCFSLIWFRDLCIFVVVASGVWALIELVLPIVIARFPGSNAINTIIAALRIVFWVVVSCFLIYFIFDLISCLLTMTGGLRLPHVQR